MWDDSTWLAIVFAPLISISLTVPLAFATLRRARWFAATTLSLGTAELIWWARVMRVEGEGSTLFVVWTALLCGHALWRLVSRPRALRRQI